MRMLLQIAAAALFLAGPPARAIGLIATNLYTVAAGETVTDEQWIYTLDADVAGTVKNELFILSGSRLSLSGTFERSVWGLGGDARLTGDAQQNVRLLGTSVQVAGHVGGNLLAMGNSVQISTNAVIAGDLRLVGNQVILEGRSGGRVSITASRVATISGAIGGDLEVVAPEIILQRNTRIGGNLTYTARNTLLPEDGMVAGKLVRSEPPAPAPAFSMARLASQAGWFFAALLVGVPFIALCPVTVALAAHQLRRALWKCMLAGLIASLFLPLAGFFCIVSIIGAPLGILLLTGWGALLYLGRIITALVIGTLLLRTAAITVGRVLAAMAAGLAVIYLAMLLPSIGGMVQLAVIWLGTGALLLGLFEKRRMFLPPPLQAERSDDLNKQPNNTKEESP